MRPLPPQRSAHYPAWHLPAPLPLSERKSVVEGKSVSLVTGVQTCALPICFGGCYAGVEGGYVAACRKVRLLDRKARIVQIKPHSLVRRYPTRGIEIITGNRPRDPCSSVWKCALCRRRDQHTIPRGICLRRCRFSL